MKQKLQVIRSFDQAAAWHLALEKTFVKTVLPQEVILFFWSNEPAVIIGKHQNPWRECSLSQMAARDVALVRRETGGGAVYHDRGNLNVSLIAKGKELESVFVQSLVKALEALGMDVVSTGRNDLCLSDGRKCCGMASAWHGDVSLIHACLLLDVDLGALEACLNPSDKKKSVHGVDSVRQRVVNLSEFCSDLSRESLCQAITDSVCASFEDACITQMDAPQPEADALAQFTSYQWNMGSQRNCEVVFEDRFFWGEVQISITMKRGQIQECSIHTDAMDDSWVMELAEVLKGCPMERDALEARMDHCLHMTRQVREDLKMLLSL